MGKEEEQKAGEAQPEGEHKFSQEQYDVLKCCSDKKDLTEWNGWRQEHPKEEIRLQGANLRDAQLKYALLWNAHLENADLQYAHLENADLSFAHLGNANLSFTNLEHAKLMEANLKGAKFDHTSLEGAIFVNAIVDGHTLFVECELDRMTAKQIFAVLVWTAHVLDQQPNSFWNTTLDA